MDRPGGSAWEEDNRDVSDTEGDVSDTEGDVCYVQGTGKDAGRDVWETDEFTTRNGNWDGQGGEVPLGPLPPSAEAPTNPPELLSYLSQQEVYPVWTNFK